MDGISKFLYCLFFFALAWSFTGSDTFRWFWLTVCGIYIIFLILFGIFIDGKPVKLVKKHQREE